MRQHHCKLVREYTDKALLGHTKVYNFSRLSKSKPELFAKPLICKAFSGRV